MCVAICTVKYKCQCQTNPVGLIHLVWSYRFTCSYIHDCSSIASWTI